MSNARRICGVRYFVVKSLGCVMLLHRDIVGTYIPCTTMLLYSQLHYLRAASISALQLTRVILYIVLTLMDLDSCFVIIRYAFAIGLLRFAIVHYRFAIVRYRFATIRYRFIIVHDNIQMSLLHIRIFLSVS